MSWPEAKCLWCEDGIDVTRLGLVLESDGHKGWNKEFWLLLLKGKIDS